jgi:trypsin
VPGRPVPPQPHLLTVFAALAACSSPESASEPCLAATEQRLFNAALDESYLGLAAAELRAIVEVSGGDEPDAGLCTGAFVNANWVVTAAHCLVMPEPNVVFRSENGAAAAEVVERIPHPSRDVALLRVAFDRGVEPAFAPLQVVGTDGDARTPDLAEGDVVEIAGYGLTETGGSRELRFLVEPVIAIESDSVLVSGHGSSGACGGDSGGPLLVRARDGSVAVAGILTSGSPTCLHEDRYVRLDGLRDWIVLTAGAVGSQQAECGTIDEAGRCLFGSAIWCADGELVSEACESGTRCGWNANLAGHRCVEPRTDPCFGVDSVGSCRDDVAARCEHGVLEREVCSCGTACSVEGTTGRPICG